VRRFRWHSAGPIPPGSDLRRLGWQLLEAPVACGEGEAHPLLVRPEGLVFGEWLKLAGATPTERKWFVMLDVADGQERARLLRLGFGDALAPGPSLEELELRVQRLIERAQAIPRGRRYGPLRLDLLAREAFVAGRALGLHPREFALLWRLADHPGEAVSPGELLGDVWRLAFRPETNSLAVHISRLRAKLRLSGVDGLIETMPDGAYRLIAVQAPAPALPPPNLLLDDHVRLREGSGEDGLRERQDKDHAA
jgi:two-component system, OmpR family, response regulator